MTNKGIAIGLDKELILNKKALKLIENAYNKLNQMGRLKLKGMSDERKKMAYLPREAIPLLNTEGTAPGVQIKKDMTTIFILPGIPQELKAMYKNYILPTLKEKKEIFIHKGFNFSKIGESQIAPYINKLKEEFPNLWIKTHPKKGPNVEIELSITCYKEINCEKRVDIVLEKLKTIILDLDGDVN
ncbi:MAG: hypothetical protein KGD63_11355 [Candidatus Lokiarchaeota archaeon]|nr:hypothetical protein [Candidatus Lokiarchaeota archaeon]